MAEMKFEQAMARLEQIVATLESGKCTLDESMTLFEEGAKLTAFCRRSAVCRGRRKPPPNRRRLRVRRRKWLRKRSRPTMNSHFNKRKVTSYGALQ